MSRYVVASCFTPILKTPHFREVFGSTDGASLPLDEQGLLRAVDMVAWPETGFEVAKELDGPILEVRMEEYPGEVFYLDKRFTSSSFEKPLKQKKILPPKELLLERLFALVGTPYIWGGNYSPGIPELLLYYPPKKPISLELELIWTLKGVDCSGLLYEVTEGYTPRNSSELVHYGQALDIQGKTAKQLVESLKPLDLIVWKGHVIIALTPTLCIESLRGRGVLIQELTSRLEEVQTVLHRAPANLWDSSNCTDHSFVVRRWFS